MDSIRRKDGKERGREGGREEGREGGRKALYSLHLLFLSQVVADLYSVVPDSA
jgi:predicted transposase YdaD